MYLIPFEYSYIVFACSLFSLFDHSHLSSIVSEGMSVPLVESSSLDKAPESSSGTASSEPIWVPGGSVASSSHPMNNNEKGSECHHGWSFILRVWVCGVHLRFVSWFNLGLIHLLYM